MAAEFANNLKGSYGTRACANGTAEGKLNNSVQVRMDPGGGGGGGGCTQV